MSGETLGPATHKCRHCGDPVVADREWWVHVHEDDRSRCVREWAPETKGRRTVLSRCQHTVPYGQNAEPGEALP